MNKDNIIRNQKYYIFIKFKKDFKIEYVIFSNYIKNI